MSHLNRRQLLLGAAATVAAAALPWEEVLHAQSTAEAKNLILVFVSGGWDVTGCLDPKPGMRDIDAPAGELRMYEDLAILTGSDRPAVARFFEEWASLTAVVNGVEVRSIAHEECTKRILTGTNSDANPDIGAITGVSSGSSLAVPYMILGNTAFTGAYGGSTGRAGVAGQFVTLLHPDASYTRAFGGGAGTRFIPTGEEAALVKQHLLRQAERDKAKRGLGALSTQRFNDLSASIQRRDLLKPLFSTFSDFSAQLEFVPQIELAIRMLKDGLSRAALIEHDGEWDTHDNNHERQLANYQSLYTGLYTLMQRLDEENLLESTAVVVLSEMSRTPKLNESMGKDHWPVTSALVLGAGVRGGRAAGATDASLLSVPVDMTSGQPASGGAPVTAAALAAGVLELVGVDAAPWFPGVAPLRGFIAS